MECGANSGNGSVILGLFIQKSGARAGIRWPILVNNEGPLNPLLWILTLQLINCALTHSDDIMLFCYDLGVLVL